MKHSPNQIRIYSTATSFINSNEFIDNTVQFLSETEKTNSKENVKSDPINNSFKYYINEYGCRGDWKLSPSIKKFGFFGCSFTFGVGVDEQHTFVKIIEQHYDNIECLNFGQGGSSVQRISKLVSTSIRMFDFDTIVITLPSMYRFLVTDNDNNYMDIVPNHSVSGKKEVAIYSCFTDLDFKSMYMDYIYWMLAETRNIKRVVWGTYDSIVYSLLKEHDIKDIVFWDSIIYDKGRDRSHPGIGSHSHYATEIIKRLE